jgi:hypothetical protein
MKQQVNIIVKFIVEFDAKHSKAKLKEMIGNYLRRAFFNNNLADYSFTFKEEAEIYNNK